MSLASRPLHSPAMRDLADAFDNAIEELDGFVSRVKRGDPVLALLPRFDGRFSVVDDANGGELMLPWTSRATCVRFARAFVVKHPEARLGSSFASSGEPTTGASGLLARPSTALAVAEPRVPQAAVAPAEPASPDPLTPEQVSALAINRLVDLVRDPYSRRVPDNVVPIRKEIA